MSVVSSSLIVFVVRHLDFEGVFLPRRHLWVGDDELDLAE